MKLLLSLLLGTLWVTSGQWMTNWEEAKTTALSSGKPILLNFSGSDWCGPCIRLEKEVFGSEVFRAFADSTLVLVKADFPRMKKNQLTPELSKQNESLAERYNPSGRFPYTVLIDAKGKVLGSWEGYSRNTPEAFIAAVNKSMHGNR